jgi:predicted dehydrogenase
MKKVAILGFGSRGRMFAKLINNDETVSLIAIADTEQSARDAAVNTYGVAPEDCYSSAEEFFAKGKVCDAVFICTQDADHYDMVMTALDLGYDICLEKPAAVSVEQCVAIRDKAKALNRKVMLTHVLRYAPFYQIIKSKIVNGDIGQVVTVTQTESIAYWHFCWLLRFGAHSSLPAPYRRWLLPKRTGTTKLLRQVQLPRQLRRQSVNSNILQMRKLLR